MINNIQEERLMLPPRISNTGMGGPRPVILRERENLQLTCATSGDPRPTVTWSRRDGWAVIDGPSKRGQTRYWECYHYHYVCFSQFCSLSCPQHHSH